MAINILRLTMNVKKQQCFAKKSPGFPTRRFYLVNYSRFRHETIENSVELSLVHCKTAPEKEIV